MSENNYEVTSPTAEQVRKLQEEKSLQDIAQELEEINEKIEYAINNNDDYFYLLTLSDKAENVLINLGYIIKLVENAIRVSW
jgi:DNA-binding transcriptional regulator GbsR (MarR family)